MLWCPSSDSLKNIDAITLQSFNLQESKSIYAIGMYDINDTPMGFISVEYYRNNYILTQAEKEILNKNSIILSNILCYKGVRE